MQVFWKIVFMHRQSCNFQIRESSLMRHLIMRHIYTVMAQKHLLAETFDSSKARRKATFLPSLCCRAAAPWFFPGLDSLGFVQEQTYLSSSLDLLLLIVASTSNLARWDCKTTWKDGLCLGTLCITSPNLLTYNFLIQDYNINLYQHNQIRRVGKKMKKLLYLQQNFMAHSHVINISFKSFFNTNF